MRADRPFGNASLALAVLGFTTLVSSSASAFCRTTTVPPPPEQAGGCQTSGLPLYHASQCLSYRLLAQESPALPNNVISENLARALGSWTARQPTSTCTPGIAAIELPPSTETTIAGYRSGERGNNLVGVPPTWTHSGGEATLALTTLTFSADTGEVYDTDLEINGDVAWSTTDATTIDPASYDLWSALTHEAGHMLGFAHSDTTVRFGADGGSETPVMYPTYTPGSTSGRNLTKDDTDAMCFVYPSRSTRLAASGVVPATACELAPAPGGGGSCAADPDLTHGCSIGTVATSSRGGFANAGTVLFGMLGMTGLAAMARRRLRSTRASSKL